MRRYLNRLIGSAGRPGRRDPFSRPQTVPAPSARKLSFRVVNPRPASRFSQILRHLREQPAVASALDLAEEMIAMLRQQRPADLHDWAARVQTHGPRELQTFAQSLLRDAAAVEAAMTTAWSNGAVEGQVNRLKLIKRQMYGRAGLPLLKARVLNVA